MRRGPAGLLLLTLLIPADAVGAAPRGPLLDRLARVEATADTRVETIVDRYAAPGADQPDETRSLAGDPDIAATATALDSVGVDTAAFSTDVSRFRNDQGVLEPYLAVAVGAQSSTDGLHVAIAFAYPDAVGARQQVRRVRDIVTTGTDLQARRPWSDLLRLEHIEARGRVTVAVLSTTVTDLWIELERSPDTLLWWS